MKLLKLISFTLRDYIEYILYYPSCVSTPGLVSCAIKNVYSYCLGMWRSLFKKEIVAIYSNFLLTLSKARPTEVVLVCQGMFQNGTGVNWWNNSAKCTQSACGLTGNGCIVD